VGNNNAVPTVLLNRLQRTGHWTRLMLLGRESNRDAIGARVRLTVQAGGKAKTMTRQVEAGSGYASQSDASLHFGLGAATAVEAVEVWWPSGRTQQFTEAELAGLVDGTVYLEEGGKFQKPRPVSATVARGRSRMGEVRP